MHFEEGALDCINPDLTVDDQAELLPYDRRWEFPRDRLKLGNIVEKLCQLTANRYIIKQLKILIKIQFRR